MSRVGVSGYDVIGDVHGHCDALVRLLGELGYRSDGGVYRHPERRAVFVGDLIDRGPDQVGVVQLVRAMVEAGSAQVVLGNHEFNAVAYATEDPDKPGDYLRTRNAKHRSQHAEFLEQVGEDSALHREIIAWFMTIPMWCELALGASRLRVVHACWHPPSMDVLRSVLTPQLAMTPSVVVEGSRKANPIYDAIENVLKGPEVWMGGAIFRDKDGHEHAHERQKWWEIYAGEVPVLFGHYWRTGTPSVHSTTTASVDFSVAAGGQLVAYRWDGDQKLSNDHFKAVPWNCVSQ